MIPTRYKASRTKKRKSNKQKPNSPGSSKRMKTATKSKNPKRNVEERTRTKMQTGLKTSSHPLKRALVL